MDTLKLLQEALRLSQEAQKPQGLSDTVLLAIIAGIVGLATIYLNSRIEARAEKAKTIAAAAVAIAAAEAEKVTKKLEAVEVKIDGRLTQLIESLKRESDLKEASALITGKEQGKKEEQEKAPTTPTTPIHDAGPLKLNITDGQINVVPETKKK